MGEEKSEETKIISVYSGFRKWTLVLVMVLILAIVVTVALIFKHTGKDTEEKLEEALSLGEKYLNELNYEQAIACYRAAIEIDPKCMDAYIGLADIYIALENYEEAVKVLEEAEGVASESGSSEETEEKRKRIREKKEEARVKKESAKEAESNSTLELNPSNSMIPDLSPEASSVPEVVSTPFPSGTPEATLSQTPEPADNLVSELTNTPTPELMDTSTLVTDAYQQDCPYESSEYNVQTQQYEKTQIVASFHIPQINLTSEDAKKINKEIYDAWYPEIQSIIEEIDESGTQYTSYGMSYYWYINGDILSLVAVDDTMWSWGMEYFVYNLSISSGRLLSKDEVYAATGLSATEQYEKRRKTLGSAFFDHASTYIEMEGCDDFIIGQLEKTVSDENIKESRPYLNESGELCIIALVYSAVVDGWEELIVQDSELNVDYENFIRLQEKAEKEPSFTNSYKFVLLKYPESIAHYLTLNGDEKIYYQNTEYTLYDINKDGIPELIIKEDSSKYYIYSFDGNTVNLCGDYLWTYYNCLYEYDGNGIIVHEGGTGSLALEYVLIYSLSDQGLKETTTLANTEECSYEELMNVLESCKPINDFYPITDDSLFSRWTENSTETN